MIFYIRGEISDISCWYFVPIFLVNVPTIIIYVASKDAFVISREGFRLEGSMKTADATEQVDESHGIVSN